MNNTPQPKVKAPPPGFFSIPPPPTRITPPPPVSASASQPAIRQLLESLGDHRDWLPPAGEGAG